MKIILLLLITFNAFAQFSSSTVKQIDQIDNNTETNITINPNGGQVVIPYLATDDLLYNDATGLQGLAKGNDGDVLTISGSSYTWTPFTGGVDLQNAYDNSTNGEIILNNTQRSLRVQDDSTPITGALFEIMSNDALTSYFDVNTSEITTPLDMTFGGTGQIKIPSGTTAQRGSSTAGAFRYNTDTGSYEGYNGSWQSFSLGGVNPAFTTVTKNSTGTLATSGEDHILADSSGGDITLTLPAASGNSGLMYKITKSTSGNQVTIDGNASETIGGELSVVMGTINDSMIITTDGSNWYYLSDDITYYVRARSSDGQTVNSTLSKFTYEEEVADTHDAYATGTFTAPIDGLYLVIASIQLQGVNIATNSNAQLRIFKNGGEIDFNSVYGTGSTNAYSQHVQMTLNLAESDTVEIHASSPSSVSASTTDSRNNLTIIRVSGW